MQPDLTNALWYTAQHVCDYDLETLLQEPELDEAAVSILCLYEDGAGSKPLRHVPAWVTKDYCQLVFRRYSIGHAEQAGEYLDRLGYYLDMFGYYHLSGYIKEAHRDIVIRYLMQVFYGFVDYCCSDELINGWTSYQHACILYQLVYNINYIIKAHPRGSDLQIFWELNDYCNKARACHVDVSQELGYVKNTIDRYAEKFQQE